jgi:hypothetical protein
MELECMATFDGLVALSFFFLFTSGAVAILAATFRRGPRLDR